jgi:hypothetical protein
MLTEYNLLHDSKIYVYIKRLKLKLKTWRIKTALNYKKASYSSFQDFSIPNFYIKMHRFKQNKAAIPPVLPHPQAAGAVVELRPTKLSRVKFTKAFPDHIRLFIVDFLYRSSSVQMHESSLVELSRKKLRMFL